MSLDGLGWAELTPGTAERLEAALLPAGGEFLAIEGMAVSDLGLCVERLWRARAEAYVVPAHTSILDARRGRWLITALPLLLLARAGDTSGRLGTSASLIATLDPELGFGMPWQPVHPAVAATGVTAATRRGPRLRVRHLGPAQRGDAGAVA